MIVRDDILVSVCFAEARGGTETLVALRDLATRMAASFRYWELVLIADADAGFDTLMRELPNVRLLKVRHGAPFYRRRAAAASEAIGDVVVLAAVDELEALDIVEMVETAEASGSIVIGRRGRGSLLNPALRALGGSAGFRVDARDMLTAAYPRTLLNRLLAHPDRLLALRFPPADHSLPVHWREANGGAGPRRQLQEVGRRFNLVQRLMVSSAPTVLSLVVVLSLLVILSSLAFSAYAVVVLLTSTPEPGWFTTSIVLSLTAFFLGCAILGLSMGLQKVIELLSGEVGEDIVDEQASGDLFGQVIQELNVEVGAGAADGTGP